MSNQLDNTNVKNHLIDFIKGVAALGVILVHFQFPGVTGKILSSVGLAGVVFFFLVSGYFAYDADDKTACRNLMLRFKRNLLITLAALAVYLAFTVVEKAASGELGEWAAGLADPVLWVRAVFMGDFEFIRGDPLWFMTALLFSYLILWVLHRFGISRYAYVLLPVLLLLRIGMETYTNSFGADWHLSGNFLVGGLPVMLLGHYIASGKDRFRKIPLYLTASYLVISAALLFVSVNVKIFGLDVSQIFKIWLAAEAFLLALRLPEKRGVAALEAVGRKYSLYIYLFHYLIGFVILKVFVTLGAPDWTVSWILPVAVIVASILFSAVCAAIFRKNKQQTVA